MNQKEGRTEDKGLPRIISVFCFLTILLSFLPNRCWWLSEKREDEGVKGSQEREREIMIRVKERDISGDGDERDEREKGLMSVMVRK